MSEISNSVQIEEVAVITEGFRPDFREEQPVQHKVPIRTMKTKRIKKRKGKRVLKRVYFEANSQNSSYSSLISEYGDADHSAVLEMNSNAVELEQHYAQQEKLISIKENSDEDDSPPQSSQNALPVSSSENRQQSDFSVPAEEDVDDSSNRMLRHNSPRQSFQVFNQ